MDLAPTQEQIDTYSAYTEAYGANYCTMIALMDTEMCIRDRVETVAPRSCPSIWVNRMVPMEAAAMFTILLQMRMVESSLSYCSALASTCLLYTSRCV